MAVAGVFNIHPDNLRLGAVRARGSPGVTLYEADLQLGSRWTKVSLARQQKLDTAVCKQIVIDRGFAGDGEKAADKRCIQCSRKHFS